MFGKFLKFTIAHEVTMKKFSFALLLALSLSVSAHAMRATGPYPPASRCIASYPTLLGVVVTVLHAILP